MPSREFIRLAAVFLLALSPLASCGGDDPVSDDDPCQGKCLANQVCDQGQCVACTSNAHCTSAAAPICRSADNVCVQCVQDSQCGAGQICANAQCVAGSEAECESDADCEGDDVCDAGTCRICRLGTCNAAGDSRCQSATIGGDTSWALCDSGLCESGACQDVQECEPGSCHGEAARCTNAGQIEECGADEICQNNVCKDPASEYDCTPNQCASSDARCSASGEIIACGSEQYCSDNQCLDNCGNGRIDSGEDCDGTNLNGKTCATLSGATYTGGTLACSSSCTFVTSGCTAPTVSTGIAAARAAAKAAGSTPATADVQITNALVTYVRPAIGQDDAGFFVQDSATGPAIFVNAAAGSGSPTAGDRISFKATEVVLDEVYRITAYSNYSKTSSDANAVGSYVQDLSKVKDITDIDTYESEIVEVLVTLTGAFGSLGSAGTGFQKAPIKTEGYTPSTPSRDFVLRLPETISNAITAAAAAQQKKLVGCDLYFTRALYWAYSTSQYSDTQLTIYDSNTEYDLDCRNAEDVEALPTTWDYTETFDSIENINASYSTTNNYTNSGITWDILARTDMDNYAIDGQGVILRNATSYIEASGLTGGVDVIAFDHKMWNNTTVATIEFFDSAGTSLGSVSTETLSNTERQTFGVQVGHADATKFKITISNSNRLIIDNVRWTNKK